MTSHPTSDAGLDPGRAPSPALAPRNGAPARQEGALPRLIWTLWLQGWAAAPEVALASLASWRRLNPGWTVRALDRRSLPDFLPDAALRNVFEVDKEPEALSDQLRLELLHRYGGVWADASTICSRPLDAWVHSVMTGGFFAFARPGGPRKLSTWFLAAQENSYIVERWREATALYWRDRKARDSYFWLNELFQRLYEDDTRFRAHWDRVPERPAANPFHFAPDAPALLAPPSGFYRDAVRNPQIPVYKLTHKFAQPYAPDSLMALLCRVGRGDAMVPADHS